jgi:hypothetical protein
MAALQCPSVTCKEGIEFPKGSLALLDRRGLAVAGAIVVQFELQRLG